MDSHSDEVETLRRQMHEVRTSMADEAQELMENARSATDWRYYWKTHPWAWCSAAAALGYTVIPTRRNETTEIRPHVEAAQSPPSSGFARRMVAELAGMAIGFVAQRGMQFLGDQLDALLDTKQRTDHSPAPQHDVPPEPHPPSPLSPRGRGVGGEEASVDRP